MIRHDTETYRPPDGDWTRAFVEFQDYAGEGESRFLRDTREALDRVRAGAVPPGPSFETLRETLVDVEEPLGPALRGLLDGGKRLRPALVLLVGQALGASGVPFHTLAVAVDVLHAATLIHDDLLLSAALCAVLDGQTWYSGGGALVAPRPDPLAQMDLEGF